MGWLTNLIQHLKIPCRVLLPAVWVFSSLLLFLDDSTLTKMYLSDWKNKNGFVLGLLFIISSSLIAVYILYFIKTKIGNLISSICRNKRTLKMISRLSDAEKSIIMYLYNSEGYTNYVDYSEPLIKALISRYLIFAGNNIPVSLGWNNEMIIKGTLQPYIWQAFQWVEQRIVNRIDKLKNKKRTPRNREAIENEICNLTDYLNELRGIN